jgi:hypothetical protein
MHYNYMDRCVCTVRRFRVGRQAVEGGLVGNVEYKTGSSLKSYNTHRVSVTAVTYVNDLTSPTGL